MLFGKIDYLNLLPFHIFLKRSALPGYVKKSIEFKKGVPSELCKKLQKRSIDAAVISSIESRYPRYKKLNLGIIAKKDVKSVLVRKDSTKELDGASMTSNMLSRILGFDGEVIIGDRALKAYLHDGKEAFYDLGYEWNQKTNLPFVFGRFCYINNGRTYKRLVKSFLGKKIKIPRYILENYAKSREIDSKDIRWYLESISYKIGAKEEKSFRIFIKKARVLNYNPN